jgi:hypothetical protein
MNPEYDELLVLAETLGEVKSKTEKLETEFSTQARPLEAATNALSAALSGIKALQFHVLDNNLGALSARVEEMRKAVDEQVGVIALELKKADETNAAKAGQDAEALRSEIAALQAQLGTLGAQFAAQLERVEFSAKEEAKKLQLIPGPAGAAGASLNPRGTFIDGETYNRLDVVSWLGSSYIAAVDGVTEKPSKNSNQWQVLASRGSGGAGGVGDFGSLAGVAQINQGGTGQTTRAAGLNALLPSQTGNVQYMLLTDGAGTVSWGAQPVAGLPSQTSNGGKLLTTDGTNASWSNAVTVSGSNATVTGTLTVNGASTLTGATTIGGDSSNGNYLSYNSDISGFCGLWMRQSSKSATNYVLASNGTSGTLVNATGASLFLRIENTTALEINTSRNVLIPTTTASTSTSSGALVVGNGTSGGLGVGGAASIGGPILVGTSSDVYLSRVGAGILDIRSASSPGTTARLDVTGTTSAGVGFRQSGTRDWFISAESAELRVTCGTSGSIFAVTNGNPVALRDTTASTSTSSGALVVSGGVGVAGAVNAGTFYGLVDGVTAPATESGYARIYVDSADGDLKVKFGDGTVKTIATDS